MSEAIKSIAASAGPYKLVIFYIFLFSVNSLVTAVIASFMNTNWSSLNPTQKFLLVMVILQNWTGVMLAFFNKSLSRVEQGKPIIDVEASVAK